MDKKIKELVEYSYKNNTLDPDRIKKIIEFLTRSELKNYIDELKTKEKGKNVIVSLPYLPNREEQKKIKSLFPNKKIVYVVDPTLLLGMKVVNNDVITELSLKDALNKLEEHEAETYD